MKSVSRKYMTTKTADCTEIKPVVLWIPITRLFVKFLSLVAFGGWENKRTTLLRKRQEESLIFSYTDEILSNSCPLKALIEITTGLSDSYCAKLNSSHSYINDLMHLWRRRWHSHLHRTHTHTPCRVQRPESTENRLLWLRIVWSIHGTVLLRLPWRRNLHAHPIGPTLPTDEYHRLLAQPFRCDRWKCNRQSWLPRESTSVCSRQTRCAYSHCVR